MSDGLFIVETVLQEEIPFFIEHTLRCIQQSAVSGEPVYILGFGSFGPKKRIAKMGRNIKRGGTVHIPAHYIPQFKTAKEFKQKVASLGKKEEQGRM